MLLLRAQMREEKRGTGQMKMKKARAEGATDQRSDRNTVLIKVKNVFSEAFALLVLVSG